MRLLLAILVLLLADQASAYDVMLSPRALRAMTHGWCVNYCAQGPHVCGCGHSRIR